MEHRLTHDLFCYYYLAYCKIHKMSYLYNSKKEIRQLLCIVINLILRTCIANFYYIVFISNNESKTTIPKMNMKISIFWEKLIRLGKYHEIIFYWIQESRITSHGKILCLLLIDRYLTKLNGSVINMILIMNFNKSFCINILCYFCNVCYIHFLGKLHFKVATYTLQ